MQKEELQRKKSIYIPSNTNFRVGYQIYFIVVGAVCFSLSLSSYIMFETGMDYYEFIIDNWKQEPIISVRMVLNAGCKNTEEEIVYYDWPGTIDGCDCLYKGLEIGECSFNETLVGCKNIRSLDAEKFYFPDRKNSSWFQICATRAKNQSFYYNLPRKNECAEGQIKCGEDEDYFYCSNEQVCPILKIAIKEIASLENQIEATSLESQTLIYTRQMPKQLPVVQFKVSEAGVCLKTDEPGMSSDRYDYLLMRVNKVDCATDPRFTEILKTDEYIFHKINRKMNLPYTLPGYEIDSKYEWGLYQRSYIMWRMKCRGEEYDNFLDQQIYLNEILDNQRDLLIISIIFFTIISFVFSILSCYNMYGYDWPCIKGKGMEESNYIFMMEVFCKFIIQIAQAVIIIKSFAQIKQEIDYLSSVIEQDCSDEFVKSQLIDLKIVLDEKVYSFNLVLLILFIQTTGLDIGVIIYFSIHFIRNKSLNQNKSEINPVTSDNEYQQVNDQAKRNNLDQDVKQNEKYLNDQIQYDGQNQENNRNQNYQQGPISYGA